MPHRRKFAAKDGGRCVIYARFSSSRQREESIEDQVRVCTAYARDNGMEVEAVYADHAASARSDDRPEFQRMVREARDGDWGVVLVYKLDRFTRDRFDAANYRVRLRDAGVELVSAMEQIPDAPEGAILESVLEGVNEWYSRSLSQNVTRGMMGNARKCMANGVRVFGYRVDGEGRYVVDEREAAIVRRAFSMAALGSTRGEVMLWLNSVCRNVRGGQWRYPSVATLLSNEKYLGVYSFGDVRVEGGMPAIVDQDVFDAANRPRPHARVGAFPLTGRLFDAETGTPLPRGRRHELHWAPLLLLHVPARARRRALPAGGGRGRRHGRPARVRCAARRGREARGRGAGRHWRNGRRPQAGRCQGTSQGGPEGQGAPRGRHRGRRGPLARPGAPRRPGRGGAQARGRGGPPGARDGARPRLGRLLGARAHARVIDQTRAEKNCRALRARRRRHALGRDPVVYLVRFRGTKKLGTAC